MARSGRSTIVKREVRGRIGVLTIDNPPENYLSEPDVLELAQLREWTAEGALDGIIITGEGKHFSAGADIDRLRQLASDGKTLLSKMSGGREALDCLDNIVIPVIAAVRGACFGGGLEIALACHIRVCAASALFAFPEVNLGLMPGLGGTSRLEGIIGRGRSMEMILGGDIVDAARALEIGLIDHIVPPREVFDFSLSLMKKMVDGRSPDVIRSVVRALNNARTMNIRDAMEEETRMFCRLAVKLHG